MEFDKYIITGDHSILDALNKLNEFVCNESLTLFVLDSDGRVVGTLTDGDIRRSLAAKRDLNLSVEEVAHKNFTYLDAASYDVREIRKAKEKGIELLPVLDGKMRIVDVVNLKKQRSYLPVDAVLMAGGRGERLRPLTDKTPKPLLQMEGKPIIDYIVEHILSYGIRNVSVTVNYLGEQIEEHFAEPFNGVRVRTVREGEFLGTIGSLRCVKEFHNDTVLVMNSDAICDADLEDYYLHFKQQEADMSVAAIPYSVSVPYGILELEGQRVKGVLEKPTYNYYANAGIYLVRREVVDLIPEGERMDATDFMELLVCRGCKVVRFPLGGTWIDIGNPQEYRKAQEMVRYFRWTWG